MKKLLGIALALSLLVGGTIASADDTDQQKKTFSSGTKPKSQDKVSGDKDKPSPKKTFGSGSSDKPKDNDKSPKKTFGSGSSDKPKDNDKSPKKTFGSGSSDKPKDNAHTNPPKTGPPSGDDVGSKPKNKSGFDSKAADAQKKAESKAAFTKGNEPASSYTDSKGKTVHIDPKDEKIRNLRSQLSEEKWRNRELREREFYSSYYSRPVVVYHDAYSSFFWYWLLDRSIEQQALWAYNNRYSMDQARYNDLLGRNAELAARVRALEAQGVPRNTAYQPTGMTDPDLMYNEDYVHAVYNPQPVPATTSADGTTVLTTLLCIFLVLGIIALGVWLVFVKKWGN